MNTRDPSRILLPTSLDNIVASIEHANGELSDISKYWTMIREFYLIGISMLEVKNLHISKEMIVEWFIKPRTNWPLIRERGVFSWTCVHSTHGKVIEWTYGLWYLINLTAIIGRLPCIFFVNYGSSLWWVSMSIILTLVNSKRLVLGLLKINQWLGIPI